MADKSKIEWTDATWNIVTGCSVVSPGCTNCYAMKLAGSRLKNHESRKGLTRDSKAGPVWTGEVRTNWQWLNQPLSWSRPRLIFVAAHGDIFHERVPLSDIASIYGVMVAAHYLRGHHLQVLTKRADRAKDVLTRPEFWDQVNREATMHIMDRTDPHSRRKNDARARADDHDADSPPQGIWLGVSVEDQKRADERIPVLLDTPAALRWISAEPLLGPVDLSCIDVDGWHEVAPLGLRWLDRLEPGEPEPAPRIDWIVAGGESGPDARPMHPDWARSLRDQCAAAGVPFNFKQWGNWAIASEDNGHFDSNMSTNDAIWLDVDGRQAKPSCNGMGEPIGMFRVSKSRAGRLLDGVLHDAFPEPRP